MHFQTKVTTQSEINKRSAFQVDNPSIESAAIHRAEYQSFLDCLGDERVYDVQLMRHVGHEMFPFLILEPFQQVSTRGPTIFSLQNPR